MKSLLKFKYHIVGFAAFLLLFWASLSFGSAHLSFDQVFQILLGEGSPVERTILFEIRLPRILLAILVGASLSVAGACLQGLFRNALADPYVLGLSSGGSLCAAIALFCLPAAQNNEFWIALSAFVGAAGSGLLVYKISQTSNKLSLDGILLAGIALGLTCSAALSLLLYFSENHASDLMLWLMGHLNAGMNAVRFVGVCFVVGSLILFAHASALNALLEGEETAASIGIEVERVKLRLLGACALLVAGTVAFCGMIGFVGLLVPHFARLIFGSDHRKLLPLSAVGGAFLMLGADLIARTLLPNGELPVGVITGCFGGPFFLWVLRRGLRNRA